MKKTARKGPREQDRVLDRCCRCCTRSCVETCVTSVVDAGMTALADVLEQERAAVCGPRYEHRADRRAFRAGHAMGEPVLGGRRVHAAVACRWNGRALAPSTATK